MKIRFRIGALLLSLLMCCSLAGCGSASRKVRASGNASKVVATAGDVEILYEELYYLTMNHIKAQKAVHGDHYFDSAEAKAELAAFVRENLLTESHALIMLGAKYGLSVEKGEIEKSVQEEMDQILEDTFGGDRKDYIASLNADYLTDHYVRTYIGVENYLPTAIILAMLNKGELDSSDETARARIYGEEMIRTIQVFLDRSDPENTLELAKELQSGIAAAQDEDARYLKMRSAIAGKYNDDFSDMGFGYYFMRGEMDSAYEDAAFALENYGVSNVVETEAGYYIIMRLPKDESYLESHFQELKEKAYLVELNRRVAECYAGMSLEMTRFGESLDYTNLPAINASGGEYRVYIISAGAILCTAAVAAVVFAVLRRRGVLGANTKKKAKKG